MGSSVSNLTKAASGRHYGAMSAVPSDLSIKMTEKGERLSILGSLLMLLVQVSAPRQDWNLALGFGYFYIFFVMLRGPTEV